jgi:hypothetical protein
VASQPAPVAQTAPVIRIVDESVVAEEMQQKAQAMAHQASQTEQAMRLAATRVQQSAQPEMDSAGPLFVSPRAEAPQQRTLFAAQEPEMDEEIDESMQGKGLFNRLANVGKSITGSSRAASPSPRVAMQSAPLERKAEVRETAPASTDEDEMYDIPAFLRRQAN